jgi:CheY-like chemotaxis protein
MTVGTDSQNADVLGQNQAWNEGSFYDFAEILVCDPVASNRAATRSALYSLGCRHIEISGTLSGFLEALENRPPDLALCEAQVGEADLCRAILELRHSERCYNPFAIIIVTAWTPSASFATDILRAGADGLLLRPFSAAVLDQRIRAHVTHQKPFIVTEGYIGPERRTVGRTTGALTLPPLNSLRMKIEGRADPDQAIRRFNTELRAARAKLAHAKQRRTSLSLSD